MKHSNYVGIYSWHAPMNCVESEQGEVGSEGAWNRQLAFAIGSAEPFITMAVIQNTNIDEEGV